MNTATAPSSDGLQATVAASITSFFVSTVGATPCDFSERPAPGFIHIHFSNRALEAPLSLRIEESRVADVMRAHATLTILEPLAPHMRLEMHQPHGPDARGHLDFLQARLPVCPAEELLAARHPHRPLDVLRQKLAGFAEDLDRGIPLGVQAPQRIRASVEALIRDAVRRYYAVVDRGTPSDIAEIVTMFAKDGVYDRAGKVLTGRRAIHDFYVGERTLEGTHQVHTLVVSNLLAHVTGVFEGVSKATNEPRRLEFADTWRWTLHGDVAFRHTYLSSGHQLTT